jgi:hypothetical protein
MPVTAFGCGWGAMLSGSRAGVAAGEKFPELQ